MQALGEALGFGEHKRKALPTDLLGRCATAPFFSLLAEGLQMSYPQGNDTALPGSEVGVWRLTAPSCLVQTWQVLVTGGTYGV